MKGVYCLIINVKKETSPKIGALGTMDFKKGRYVYVGSAQNNVGKRVARHFSEKKKIRWHIDYLLANPDVKIEKALCKKADKSQECKIACLLSKLGEPVKSFGCSDCSCYSHLFRLKSLKNFNTLRLKEIKYDMQMA